MRPGEHKYECMGMRPGKDKYECMGMRPGKHKYEFMGMRPGEHKYECMEMKTQVYGNEIDTTWRFENRTPYLVDLVKQSAKPLSVFLLYLSNGGQREGLEDMARDTHLWLQNMEHAQLVPRYQPHLCSRGNLREEEVVVQ